MLYFPHLSTAHLFEVPTAALSTRPLHPSHRKTLARPLGVQRAGGHGSKPSRYKFAHVCAVFLRTFFLVFSNVFVCSKVALPQRTVAVSGIFHHPSIHCWWRSQQDCPVKGLKMFETFRDQTLLDDAIKNIYLITSI